MSGYWRVALGVVAAVLLTVSEANADVVAVIDHKVPSPSRTDNDIVLVNAGTGSVSPVAFDTTSSDEIHPSVSSDGSRIAYESFNPSNDVSVIRVSDLRSGQTASLGDTVDEAGEFADGDPPVGISPDGQRVATGGSCLLASSGFTVPVWVTTLSNFPTGPFARSEFSGPDPHPCDVSSPVLSGPLPTSTGSIRLAAATLTQFTATAPNGSSEIIIMNFNKVLSSDTADYSDPSVGSPGGVATLLFEESSSKGQSVVSTPAPLTASSRFEAPQPVSGINFTNGMDPTITADGRYVGFLRSFPGKSGWFLFVWDTTTQMLLNPQGVSVGDVTVRGFHGFRLPDILGPYLYEITVFRVPGSITASGTVNFALAATSAVGILVQRVIGHHRLFGRLVPTLRVVGHVPLGRFKRGKHRLRWNLKVNGHRLKRGTYQVTLRSLTRSKKIRDFGGSRIIHVR